MEQFRVTGGARIGWVNATWPLATLSVSPTRLRLTGLIGTYDFLPSDVVFLERFGSIPFFSSGVRIVHARRDFPPKIIFWYLGKADTLIDRIRQTGFSPSAPVRSAITHREFPMRWAAILLAIVAWNGLFLLDHLTRRIVLNQTAPGVFSMLTLFLAFLACWGIRASPRLQTLVLKDGHSVTEIKSPLLLIQIVTGFLLIIFSLILFTQTLAK